MAKFKVGDEVIGVVDYRLGKMHNIATIVKLHDKTYELDRVIDTDELAHTRYAFEHDIMHVEEISIDHEDAK